MKDSTVIDLEAKARGDFLFPLFLYGPKIESRE